MIFDLKPYPDLKSTSIPWLGELPATWSVCRNGSLFVQRNEKGFADLPILEVSLKTGVRVREFGRSSRKQIMEDRAKYKRASCGDLAYNMMRMWQGAVGVSPVDGLVSPAYVVARPLPGVLSNYFAYLFRTDAYMGEVDNYSRGIVKDRNRLYWEQFKQIQTPCPPACEQATIVRFLDHADRNIRRYIRAKQKLIKLLEEQITARASDAMRHSACTNQRLGRVTTEHIRTIAREDAETYVALGLYNRGRGIFHKRPTVGTELGDSTFSWVEPGDLVISGQFAWEGAVALAASAEKRTIVSHRYYILRGIQGRTTASYLWALLRSDFGAMLLDQHSRGAAGRNRPLNLRTLLKEQVPIPPYEMQLAVDDELAATAPLRIQAAQAIERLHEYRTRLIADVVTGKLDVREAAAGLPEEVIEHEFDDDEDGVELETGEEDLDLNDDAEV